MKGESTAANDRGGSKTHKKRKHRDESSPSQPQPSKSSKKRKIDETAEDPPTAPPAAPVVKEVQELRGKETSVVDETQKKSKKRKNRKSDVAEPSDRAAAVIFPNVDSKRRDSTDSKEAPEASMGQRMSYEDVREQERLQAEKEKLGKSKKKSEKKERPNGFMTEEPSIGIATVSGPSTFEKTKRKKKKVQIADIDAAEEAIPGAEEEADPVEVSPNEKSKKKRRSKSTGGETTATPESPEEADVGLHDLKRRVSQEVQKAETPLVEVSISKKKRKHRDSNDAPTLPAAADPTPIAEVESPQVEKPKTKKKRKSRKEDEEVSISAETTQETPIEPQNTDITSPKSKKRKRDRKGDTQEIAPVETQVQDPPISPDTTLPDKEKRKQKHKSPKPADLTDPLTMLMPPPPTPDPNRASKTPSPAKIQPANLLPIPFDPPIPPQPKVPRQLRHLLNPTPSPFILSRMTLLLDINPIGLLYAQETALAACLAPLVGSYFTPLDGLILSFHAPWMQDHPPKNLKRSLPNKKATRILDAAHAADLAFAEAHPDEEPPDPEDTELAKLKKVKGLCHDEDEAPKVWISASFLLFRPRVGMKLTGFVNMQTESSISLLLYNLFTVSIDAKRLGSGFSWVAAGSSTIKSPDKTTSLKSSPIKGGIPLDIDEDPTAPEDDDETALVSGHWLYTSPNPAPKTPPPKSKKGRSKSKTNPSTPLKPGHALTFRSLNYDIQTDTTESGAPSSFVSIEGTLLSHREEREAIEEEKERWMKRWGPRSELDESRDWEGAIEGVLRKTGLVGEDGDGDVQMSGALVDSEAEESVGEDDEGEGEDLMDED